MFSFKVEYCKTTLLYKQKHFQSSIKGTKSKCEIVQSLEQLHRHERSPYCQLISQIVLVQKNISDSLKICDGVFCENS